ncbi:hypothetical protein [Pseudodesulfovibrio sp.]|uniref:hypothetical protein n=1 Tax=Pseudodesulfovibrio sp. TaxID=2035812 RepID=UPI002606DCC6|nr:hypothetical protein [Pseudodesulfovibrio sp.]MDD3311948.1 hypothetical protein [Pseudodesulfovibrio sp.]
MRPFLLICLLLSLLLAASCSKQWSNPESGDKRQSEAKFKQDSLDCDVKAGERFPLDKRRQLEVYDQCMEDRGWARKEAEIRFGRH